MPRIAVLSDLHSNLEALESVFAEVRAAGVEHVFVCGDIVGYGAEPSAVLQRVYELPLLGLVAGNHDLAAVDRFPLGWFNAVAAEALRWTREQLTQEEVDTLRGLEPIERARDALLVHGSVAAPAEEYLLPYDTAAAGRSFELDGFERCFFGHTHVPTLFERDARGNVSGAQVRGEARHELREDRRYLLNPGSVGQPRDGDPRAAFLLLDGDARTVEWRRVPYDVAATQGKIRGAGLPEVLAERLAQGR